MKLHEKKWWVVGALFLTGLSLPGTAAAQGPAALWNDATIYRDSYGTPHIQAASVRSMAFAFGYAQSEDHLESMLMAYRVALGRAAVVGGESFAEGDAFAIKIANAEVSRAAMAEADSLTRDLCQGFALGINTWIVDHKNRVPDWVEGVQPMDVLAYWHYLMVTSAPFDLPNVYHPGRPLERANAWALAPSNTVDGKTLLVMNPHQYYRAPYQWYEAHLMVNDVNWSGATLLGVPVLMMGHNAHLGWALTPNEADTADFFREDMSGPDRNPNDITRPSIMSELAPVLSFMSTAKTYFVRMGEGLVERSVPSLVGNRGPIMEGERGELYSWRNGGFRQFGGMRQLLFMAQATDLAAFQEAMLLHQLPCFQVLYADKEGNIFYLYNARTGDKNSGLGATEKMSLDWSRPVNAGRDRFAWETIVEPGRLPSILNPKAGYLQACGTPPWLATSDSGLAPADWPSWLVPEDESYRVFRVRRILSSGKYTLDDMEAMLFDTLVPAAVDMVPLLLSMAKSRSDLVRRSHPDLVTGLTLLKNWDRTSDRGSEAMAFYSAWWTLLKERNQANFASEAAMYRALLENSPGAQAYALEAAADAARGMRNDYNRLAIPWGELHRLNRGLRNEALFGTDAGDPIFLASSKRVVDGALQADFGYGFAMAVEFGETPQALSIVPFGASENAQSPHYNDQMPIFLDRSMKSTHFSYEDVTRHAVHGYGRHVVLGVPGLDGFCAFTTTTPGEVSLESVDYPPRPYPAGHVPFTPTVRPKLEHGAEKQSWELEWQVSESVCRAVDLPRLRFFNFTPEDGWKVLLRQRYDGGRETFTGSTTGNAMVVLMGPSDLLLTPEPAQNEPTADEGTTVEAVAESGAFAVEQVEGDDATDMTEAVPTDAMPADKTGAPVPSEPQVPERRLFDIEIMDNGEGEAPATEGELDENGNPTGKKKRRGLLKSFRKSKD